MSSQFGKFFSISTFGESHGPAVGVVIDGCPAQIPFDISFIQKELDRRRPGQSSLTTQRQEGDQIEILSGVFEGKTTGTPIALLVRNSDAKSKDYDNLRDCYRPSHADFTYQSKYGHRDHRGGGRSSARETIGRVAAGALAKLFLQDTRVEIVAYVSQVGTIDTKIDPLSITIAQVESNPVRCPDPDVASLMEKFILNVRKEGDSVGGIITLVIKNAPVGLGEPIFDRLEARLGMAMLSLPATKGFEIGSGFAGSALLGSAHNDLFTVDNNQVRTISNNSGGVQGGISNGMPIICRIAFKPTATILTPQPALRSDLSIQNLQIHGRHDPCVVPRAVVMVEAMAALTLADFYLEYKARKP